MRRDADGKLTGEWSPMADKTRRFLEAMACRGALDIVLDLCTTKIQVASRCERLVTDISKGSGAVTFSKDGTLWKKCASSLKVEVEEVIWKQAMLVDPPDEFLVPRNTLI